MKIIHKLKFGSLAIALLYLGSVASAAGLNNNIAVRLVGTADMYIGDTLFEKFTQPPVGAMCYDVDLVDA